MYIKVDSDLRIIKMYFVNIFEVENQPLWLFFSSMYFVIVYDIFFKRFLAIQN